MKLLFAVAALCAASHAVSIFEMVNDEWTLYKLEYNKTYSSDMEEGFRMKIYLKNKRKIAKHNSKFEKGLVKFTMGLNHLSDMLPQEIAMVNGYRRSNHSSGLGISYIEPAHVQLEDHVDWRTKGAVTPVKDQGQCGSCWAFSTTGALEGQHFRKTGKLVSLSEQNLVDCSSAYGNQGCSGGMPDLAFKYVQDNHGIDTEDSYPYDAKDEQCHFKQNSVGATDRGYVDIPSGNEARLRSAVATVGPVSVAIDASQETFHHYHRGIYSEPLCKSGADDLDHAVLVVGYGTEDGVDYWLVKNSWGPRWGENGYIRMARNQNNNCGIASAASYPLV